MSSQSSRRRFLTQAAIASGLSAHLVHHGFAWEPPTASATKGPFYPIPEIAKQKYYDADLTRLDPQSPVAQGDQILVRGVVVGMDEKPLDQVIVEVWQACAAGRYNHPQDKNDRPMDPNFQYWAKILTGADGAFSFRTIQPGKYPGRTPHIHYRIDRNWSPRCISSPKTSSTKRTASTWNSSPSSAKRLPLALNPSQSDPIPKTLQRRPSRSFRLDTFASCLDQPTIPKQPSRCSLSRKAI
jgi:protocatechuate 3,4-dioxygenase beta subunit